MDVLERLQNLLACYPTPTYANMAIEATLRDAADEIKRLRSDIGPLLESVAQLEGERGVMQRWISEAVVALEVLSGGLDFEEGGDDFTRFLIDGSRLATPEEARRDSL